MEKQKLEECTPLLTDVANHYISDLSKCNKEKNTTEKNEAGIQKEIYSNEHALHSAKIDKTFTQINSNKDKETTKYNDKKLEQCNAEKQPSSCHSNPVDVYQATSIGKIIFSEDRMISKTENGGLITEGTQKGDNSLANNNSNYSNSLFNNGNSRSKNSVSHNLMRPLGDLSSCELLALSSRHMLKVILTTSPIIIVVCLTGFCLSKLPYTKTCPEYTKISDCRYYNETLIFGVNRTLRLVSTWISHLLLTFNFSNSHCSKNKLFH